MSRSKRNEQSSNPTERYFQWSGGEGILFEYNKEKKEKEALEMPVRFAVLDVLSAVSGYSDSFQTGIWSNEVKQLDSEKLWVSAGQVKIAEGYYADIKDKVKGEGGKYAASVYAAVFTGSGDPILANIKFQGAALNAWINFQKGQEDYKANGRVKILDTMIMLVGPSDVRKKGATKYYEPVFATDEITEIEDEQAQKLDEDVLQPYLKSRSQIQQKPEQNESEGTNNIYDPEAGQIDDSDQEDPIEVEEGELPF